ncbi:RNA polymerase sigma factor [Actinomadura hibisca]|uniref:RNA polymerase sigma factor n=1 Tax=Actinomadura hibisca TaxID=68565 RepID=UPI0008328F5E|nr:RNA polymerase sigma factor [Actinomadura hibisca]
MTASDAELVRSSLHRPEHFAELFDRHGDEIHRYVARRLGAAAAEDVVAETFLTAFRKRASYDLDRPDARPWLYGIAAFAIRDHLRSEQRRGRLLARLRPARAESFDERSDARVAAQGLRPELAAALARLSPDDRELLLLIAWAELSYEEAARALGVPLGTVRSRLHRIRAKMRGAFGGVNPLLTSEESLA